VAIVLSGLALLALLVHSEVMHLPGPLEVLGHLLFRLAFWICFPLLVFFNAVLPPEASTTPLARWIGAALCTPPLYWGLWRLRRRLTCRAAPPAGLSPGRRRLLRAAGAGAGLAVLGPGLYGVVVEPSRLCIRRYRIAIEDLPPGLDGLRIVHLSDTHHGPYVPLAHIQRAVAASNQLRPDLVLLTGDYVHFSPRAIPRGVGVFAGLKAPWGCFAVLGNHDHWEGEAACRRRFAQIKVPVLENTCVFLTPWGVEPEPRAHSLCLGGVGDLTDGDARPRAALAGVPASTPRLLLSHNPDLAELLPAGLRVDLMLAGHTHGGQLALPHSGPFWVPSNYGSKYAGGLCQGPRCPVLVSRGVGMSVLPVRLGVPPEISLITLVEAL